MGAVRQATRTLSGMGWLTAQQRSSSTHPSHPTHARTHTRHSCSSTGRDTTIDMGSATHLVYSCA